MLVYLWFSLSTAPSFCPEVKISFSIPWMSLEWFFNCSKASARFVLSSCRKRVWNNQSIQSINQSINLVSQSTNLLISQSVSQSFSHSVKSSIYPKIKSTFLSQPSNRSFIFRSKSTSQLVIYWEKQDCCITWGAAIFSTSFSDRPTDVSKPAFLFLRSTGKRIVCKAVCLMMGMMMLVERCWG